MSVFEMTIDTVLMCFFVDRETYGGKYSPKELADHMSKEEQKNNKASNKGGKVGVDDTQK